MSGHPSVSVVVPTYGRRESVLRLLGALREQTLAPDAFEVIVAVDGSEDGTREATESLEAPFTVRTLWHPNQGRAATVNAGVAAANGEIVLVLDDDMEPSSALLAAHLRAHEGRRVGVVGAAPVVTDASTRPFGRFRAGRFNDVQAELARRADELVFTDAYTGNFSVRRADFDAVGGFDESFDGYGLEDYEFALRLSEADIKLVFSVDAVAYQTYDKDFAAAARDNESRGRSMVIFAGLHPAEAPEVRSHDAVPPSLARRLVRYVLPRMTPLVPGLRTAVVRSVERAERAGTSRLPFAYELGLEYFTLVGYQEATRDGVRTARGSRW
jgi:GT2 family glycosyltransferase